jgi:hypothetical protein
MADGIIPRPTYNPHEPPDYVKLVVEMVWSLSNTNKYVPTPSLDEVEIDLLQGLTKDFRNRVHKLAKGIKFCKSTVEKPAC